MNWLLAIPVGAVAGLLLGYMLHTPDERDAVMGDFVAQKLHEYESKPYGDMQVLADVFHVTPENEDVKLLEWWDE